MNTEFHQPASRKHRVLLLLIVVLAAIPSLWVIQTRWLDPFPGDRLFRDTVGWCSWQLFCLSTLPVDVIIGFLLCASALAVLFLLVRKTQIPLSLVRETDPPVNPDAAPAPKRMVLLSRLLLGVSGAGFLWILADGLLTGTIPGWNLLCVYLCFLGGCLPGEHGIIPDWRKWNAGFFLSLLINHLLLIAVLWSFSGHRAWLGVALAAFVLSLGLLLLQHRRPAPIYFIFLLAILLFTLANDTWWSSWVGDEYTQFDLNYSLSRSRDPIELGNHIFSTEGNFGTTPLLATYVQVFFMKVLGTDGFGWRFSNAYLCAAGIVLFYYFLRRFVVERIALTSAALLASSEYLISFGKIGYTNLQAFFALMLVLALAGWSARSKSKTGFCLLGSAMAFCFYTFPAALYVLPLPVLFLCFYDPPKSRAAFARWGILLAGLGMLIFPLFLQPDFLMEKIPGTILANPNAVQSVGDAISHVASNVFYAFFSFLYIQRETHFVTVSYTDPVTGMLIWIGFFFLLFQIRKSRFLAFWMAGFVLLLLAVGASHGYNFPPTTRMFLMLPWWMVFAAAGLDFLAVQASSGLRNPRVFKTGFALAILILVIGVNEYQAQRLSYNLYASRPPVESIFLQQAEEANQRKDGKTLTFLFITDTAWSIHELARFPLVYPEIFAGAGLSQVRIASADIPQSARASIADPGAVVFLIPFFHSGWERNVDEILRLSGKNPCRIQTVDGVEVVVIYSPPGQWLTCRARWGYPP